MSKQTETIEDTTNAVEDVWSAFLCHFDEVLVKEERLAELRKTLCIEGQKELMRRMDFRYRHLALLPPACISIKELNTMSKEKKEEEKLRKTFRSE